VESLIKPYAKISPQPPCKVIQSFAKKISNPTGSIFFAKTLQFSNRTAFWMLKVSLMIYSFYVAASVQRAFQRKIVTNKYQQSL